MNKHKKLLAALITTSTLISTYIPLSPAVSLPVKDAGKTFKNISLNDVQKQQVSPSKTQLLTQSQGKKNKQKSVPELVQDSVVQIQVGCTASVYWADNKKTYKVTAGAEGSGFFVSQNGYAATNAHVTELAENSDKCLNELFKNFVIQLAKDYNLKPDELNANYLKYFAQHSHPENFQRIQRIILQNGKQLPFQMIVSGIPGSARDVAVIKIDMKNAPVLKIGNNNDTRLLDRVIVAGYPGLPDGLDQRSYYVPSFTEGTVSAHKYLDGFPVLQISAPVTHGNSGGPVINDKGEVIGMVTFGSAPGFSFAVPSNTIMLFLRQAGIMNGQQVVSQK